MLYLWYDLVFAREVRFATEIGQKWIRFGARQGEYSKKIRPKIRQLLKILESSEDIIQAFTRGYCNGLVTLALYYFLIEAFNIENPLQQSYYNWLWLDTILKRIADWDEQLYSLDDDEYEDIKYLIGQLEFYQHCSNYMRYSQGSLHKILQDSANRIPQFEYCIAGLFTRADFFKKIALKDTREQLSLIEILLKYEKRLITISRGRHSLGIFRNGNTVIFYNANSGRKEFALENLSGLITEIYKAYKFNVDKPSPIAFRLHTFADKVEKYPAASYVLEQLKTPAKTKKYSAIHLAARIGSKECIKHYIKNGMSPNEMSRSKRSVLYVAASKGFTSIVKMLLKKGADINQECRRNRTPLTIAAARGRVAIVKLMLETGQNFTLQNLFNALAHFKTDRERLELLRRLDKTKLVTINIKRKKTFRIFQAYQTKNQDHSCYREQIYTLFPNKIKDQKQSPTCSQEVSNKEPVRTAFISSY